MRGTSPGGPTDLVVIRTAHTSPYENLGLEQYLTGQAAPGQCILYLWQNRPTVVIGRNQNVWAECRPEAMEEDGVLLARRLSGGGAVYHDLGNLNFTFIARSALYSVPRHLEVILKSLSLLGIPGEISGRNDLTVRGRKFSGNAFYRSGDFCCHHGTLLVDADLTAMSRYLSVSKEKLASKGVASVPARVVNLKTLAPDLTIDGLCQALIQAFGQVYGASPREISEEDLPSEELSRLAENLSSPSWLYGRKIPFNSIASGRFPWGNAELLFVVNEGRVRQVQFFSDAMDQEWVRRMEEALPGCPWSKKALAEALAALSQTQQPGSLRTQMAKDLTQLMNTCFADDFS